MMQANLHLRYTCFAILIIIAMGCSGVGDPVAPVEPSETPTASITEPKSGSERMLWGIWDLYFDPVEMEVNSVPIRESAIHADVTAFLLPPNCDDCVVIAVNSFDPLTRILDVDVTLRNPTLLNGRDVRGIFMTNDLGHELRNPDDWTKLWDIPGGQTLNPFKAFAKSETNRQFAGGAEHTENYLVYIPQPPQYAAIKFAVDASWPSNCKEPYSIEDFVVLDDIYNVLGTSCIVEVNVYDWQDDVTGVTLVLPEITGEGFTAFTHIGGTLWRLELINNGVAAAGEFEGRIIASSPNGQDLALYDFVTVTVTIGTQPVVTSLDPDSAKPGADLSGVILTGTDFQGPDATILLRKDLEIDIVGTNVVVVDENTITFDMNIHLLNGLGMYDIRMTDDTGLVGLGYDVFEVLEPVPDDPVDVTPPRLNFAPYGICVSGDYAYVAGYMTGMHIFDITDPSDPVWAGRTDIDGDAHNIAVSGGYAYVAAHSDGLFVVDVTSPDAPEVVGWVDTARATAVSIAGNYAYLADGSGGLRIIDISVPDSPSIVNTVDTTGSAKGVTVAGGYAYVADEGDGLQIIDIDPIGTAAIVKTVDTDGSAYGVTVSGGYAYVADGGAGLQVIDIDPVNTAAVVKSVDTSNWAYDVTVSGNYAYLADGYGGLQVFDIEQPELANIVHEVGIYGETQAVVVDGNIVYLADMYTGLYVIDIETPASASILKIMYTPGYAGGIAYRDGYAYVGAYEAGVMIFDIDPLNEAQVIADVETDEAYAIALEGDYAYLADWNIGNLRILDIGTPEAAYLFNSVNTPGVTTDVAVDGGYAYTAEGSSGMSISDIDPPGSASLVITVPTTDRAQGVAVMGGYAYVADEDDGLHIIDIDPVGSAYIYNTVAITGQSIGITVSGDYAYVAAKAGGLVIVDINPPDTASVVKTIATPDIARDVVVNGDYAYVCCSASGLVIIDIAPVGNAHIISECDTPGYASDVFVQDNFAYVADMYGGFRIIRLW